MVNRVLVPMDDSELAGHALEYALEVHPGAEITIFHVVGGPSSMMGKAVGLMLEDDVGAAGEERAESVFERAREIAADTDASIETEVGYGQPARAIVQRAADADVIVMGSHGGSLRDRLFVGDTAKTVFDRSPVPVTVVR